MRLWAGYASSKGSAEPIQTAPEISGLVCHVHCVSPSHPRTTGQNMNAKLSLLVLLAVLVFALPAPAATQQPHPADPADVESIDAILTAVYEVISGDAGVKRDWDRFRSLFAPGATLSPTVRTPEGAYGRQIITPDEYAGNVGSWLEENGFHEVEINRVTERYGVIAHAFSTYESRRLASDPEPFAPWDQLDPAPVRRDALVGGVDLLAPGERRAPRSRRSTCRGGMCQADTAEAGGSDVARAFHL